MSNGLENGSHSDFVLCIDDKPDMLKLVKCAVELTGAKTKTAKNGKQGLESVDSEHVPLANMCDLQMPVMDGEHFLVERSKIPYLANVPFVLLSCERDEGRKIAREHNVPFMEKYDVQGIAAFVRDKLG